MVSALKIIQNAVLLMQAKSGAELCSAFCSAASEDLATVCGSHSLAEAVLFLALTLLGLVSTQHNFLHSFQD